VQLICNTFAHQRLTKIHGTTLDVRQNIDEAIDDLGKAIEALGLEITQSVIEHEEHNA
jgi:hypothetical protein